MLECPWLLGALSLAGSHQLGTRHLNQILSEPCLLLSYPRSAERRGGSGPAKQPRREGGRPMACGQRAGGSRLACPPTGNKGATEQHRTECAPPAFGCFVIVVEGEKRKRKIKEKGKKKGKKRGEGRRRRKKGKGEK